MSQVCAKCAHVNPPEAIFCYFDGVTLGSHSGNGRRVQPGSQPFPSQFVFPSGQACRNFDQFAIACQENWKSAVDLLKQGFLASFLGGIGRADLALAAKEAARFPDIDRGLDRLLARLPTQVLEAPKLRVEPTEVNLGVIPFGTNHKFELHLSNLGSRLLYGSVSSDCKWLTLGDAPGNSQKLFQFGGDQIVPVQIRGKYLRAGNKALSGHLLVESNGGQATVTVRLDVPPRPYPNGILAGATTPRQIAEKAIPQPKEAALLFESGAVAKWFSENGWVYPVRGPSAGGVGGVQQFFEALGLAKPPKVEVSQTSLALQGNVGESVQASLELRTQEKRPVYAHAVCDQPWLDVSQSVLNGRLATIQVLVPRVPNRSGETLTANVTITANGNQKFKVTVSLTITGQPGQWVEELPETMPLLEPIVVVEPIPVPALGQSSMMLKGKPPTGARQTPVPVVVAAPPASSRVAPVLATAAPYVPSAPLNRRDEPSPRPGLPLIVRLVMHAAPAVLLALFMLMVIGRDVFFAPGPPAPVDEIIPIDPIPRIAVNFDIAGKTFKGAGGANVKMPAMNFGLVTLSEGKEDSSLTFDKLGATNSTVLRIGGKDYTVGQEGQGVWITKAENFGTYGGKKSVWMAGGGNGKIQVTQLVDIIPGEPVKTKRDGLKRYLDTCRVRWVLENKGKVSEEVGLRFLLDTLIGENDGVPFTVPGQPGLVDKMAEYPVPKSNKPIPDFLQVLERPNLKDHGIIGFVNLKLGGNTEPPSRVLLTQWPGYAHNFSLDKWDVPLRPFGFDPTKALLDARGDSAVVLYWRIETLKPGEKYKREVGFAYGLGNLSVGASGKLGISVGGNFTPNGELTVVALVNNPEKGQKLTLKLKPGLSLVEGQAEQPVQMAAEAAAQQSPVTWRIRAEREGTFVIEVQSSTGVSQEKTITIKAKTIF